MSVQEVPHFGNMNPITQFFILVACIICLSYCFPANNHMQTRKRKIISVLQLPSCSYVINRPLTYEICMGERNKKIKNETSIDFVFPGNMSPTATTISIFPRLKAIKQSPLCAKGSTFCEKFDDYPRRYLEYLFPKVASEFKELLGIDELNSVPIEQRVDGISGKDSSLCPSIEQIVYPKIAKNKDGKWLYVVNQAEYIQGVRIEKCLKIRDSCFFSESFPMGYKAVCKQKYIYRKMVALNEEGKPVTDTFQLPSCCSCFVTWEETDFTK